MHCPTCGKEGLPDNSVGYNGDDVCPDCKREEVREWQRRHAEYWKQFRTPEEKAEDERNENEDES